MGELEGVVAALARVCRELPGSEQYVMVHHPAFRVGKKPFAIAGLGDDGGGVVVSVNLGVEVQAGLLGGDPRFTRTPYIGQHGWVSVEVAALGEGELQALVAASWRRIAGKKRVAALDAATPATTPKATPKTTPSSKTKRKR